MRFPLKILVLPLAVRRVNSHVQLHPEIESYHLQRDWSELSPDLLHLISIKLTNLFDFVRFCTVFKHWLSTAPTSDHHPLLPCLFGRTSHGTSDRESPVIKTVKQYYQSFYFFLLNILFYQSTTTT